MYENKNIITVKNAESEPDTTAEIVIQNKIDYEPKVSVIIPVYNVEEYLRQCLDSVINQTLKEIEIICVDDGSTDSSLEILKEYAKKDNRITVISRENKGVSYSRNQCIEIARGEYVAFMDPDDYYPSDDILEYLHKKSTTNKVEICGGSLIVFDETKGIEIKKTDNNNKFEKDKIIKFADFQYDYGFQRYIYKLSFIKSNNLYFPEYIFFEDPIFLAKALVLAQKFYATEKYVYAYRKQHQQRVWTEEKTAHLLMGIRDSLLLAQKNNLDKLFKENIFRLENDFNSIIKKYKTPSINYLIYEIKNIKAKGVQKHNFNSNIKPKVSVILPIYNAEPYLCECLDSVVNQTLKNIEIICVNDGSTDNSLNIIKEYAEKDERIKYIDKPNAGYGHTMNCGLDLAIGEYIGIVEPDDFIKSNMYETLYNKAKEYDCDFVKADFQIFVGDGDNREFTYRNVSHKKDYYNKVLTPIKNLDIFNTNNVTCCGIYKKDLIVNNNIRYNETPGASYQDNGFYFQTYCLANKVFFVDTDFYQIRRDNPNSSVKSITKAFVMCDEYKYIENFIKTRTDLSKNVWSIYYLKKYQNYYWRFVNVTKEIQLPFLKRFSEEMKIGLKKGYILSPIFSKSHIDKIKILANDYKEFYRLYLIQNDKTLTYRRDLENWYKRAMKQDLNLDNPQTFNEKIQWLKLYDSTPLKTRLADKYLVRDWVKETIGEEYLIPLLGVYDKFDDIDFDKLPNKFVMKCNHASGWNIIVTDKSKLDLDDAKQKMDKWISDNFAFRVGCELHYRDIPPKIVIEKFLDEISNNIYDYRFFCCNGKVEQIWLDIGSGTPQHKRKIYDKNWRELNIKVKWPRLEMDIPKPKNLEKMIELSEKMSKEFALVRVDFYDINDKIYFGEMTFTSMSGTGKFEPEIEDLKLGQKIKLPKLAYNIDTGEYYDLSKVKQCEEHKPSYLKSYLFFPYYLLKIRSMKRKLGKLPPSRLFSITKHGNKKVYRILGVKFAFNNFKKDALDNQERILKMLSDISNRQKKLEKEISELKNLNNN